MAVPTSEKEDLLPLPGGEVRAEKYNQKQDEGEATGFHNPRLTNRKPVS